MCELISAPNIITFLPNPLLSDNEKLPRASNQIPYPGYSFFSKSVVFVVNLEVPNKEFPNSNSLPTV